MIKQVLGFLYQKGLLLLPPLIPIALKYLYEWLLRKVDK